jgi:hypothetical protein
MSTESNPNINQELSTKLQQIRSLVDECIAGLRGRPRRSRSTSPATRHESSKARSGPAPVLDFDVHERAFVKTHGRNLTGPKKVVVLLAYLTKGQVGKEVQLKEIEKHWNKMTALLGGEFNRFNSNSAKERGWVNTKKTGLYFLRPTWKDIFK